MPKQTALGNKCAIHRAEKETQHLFSPRSLPALSTELAKIASGALDSVEFVLSRLETAAVDRNFRRRNSDL